MIPADPAPGSAASMLRQRDIRSHERSPQQTCPAHQSASQAPSNIHLRDPSEADVTQYRVKAYYIDETEREEARQLEERKLIRDAEWTEGYVLGLVDDQNFSDLMAKGLVVTPI